MPLAASLGRARALLRARCERDDLDLIAAVLAIKLALFAFGWVAYEALAGADVANPTQAASLWRRWDVEHYLWLAEHGYTATGDKRVLIAFPPLLPWLIRLVTWSGLSHATAGFLVAQAASLSALLLLRRLAALDLAPAQAWRAALLLAIFPTSYFLHVPYTEGLFLACVLGALLAARRGRWPAAGLLAAGAALTRLNGVLLAPVLALEAYSAWRTARNAGAARPWNPAWAWLLLPVVGVAVYLGLNQQLFGRPLAFLDVQREHWYRTFDWPWNGLLRAWSTRALRPGGEAQIVVVQELFFSGLTLTACVYSALRQRASYALWMAGNWLLITSQGFVYCVPRFSLTLFPMFLALAEATERPLPRAVVWAWSWLFLGLFSALFVQGRWAF